MHRATEAAGQHLLDGHEVHVAGGDAPCEPHRDIPVHTCHPFPLPIACPITRTLLSHIDGQTSRLSGSARSFGGFPYDN
ncbi:hypothetical protein ATOP_14460 [Granulimonas faecalis]|uniref:Uncharacterized protein n=1 Tax=Granulimonas faecalis TaxID=2894155 RepID=A0AAV5B2L4_9ACTN|nr:hypothetical protein ATOP_14460 [Granulimonas faecalis]